MAKRKKTTRKKKNPSDPQHQGPGRVARAGRRTMRSYRVGALPLIDHVLKRMKLDEFLDVYLPPDQARTKLPTRKGLMLLLKNFNLSREPVYGVGDWAELQTPNLVGVTPQERDALNDDRLGRCLDRLFEASQHELTLAVVRHVIQEFDLKLDELHNDSTTISFFGAYSDYSQEGQQRGKRTPAITYGHSKARRPDLKQLLYILTVSEDGGVPVYFATKSGNTTDDRTHQETWELLSELVGRRDFLYVADCKLATMDNMRYIDRQKGRFVSVLPATRKEDAQFRAQLLEPGQAQAWEHLDDVWDEDEEEIVDRVSVWSRETLTSDGYRLWWYHSTRKADRDDHARLKTIQQAIDQLNRLRGRMTGPRTRFRQREKVFAAVHEIVEVGNVRRWLKVEIIESPQNDFRQATRERPGKNTKYVKQEKTAYDLQWHIDHEALEQERAGDGVFPLVTNVREFTALDALEAYKRQPVIEKRFSQLKTDFGVAPVYLKNVSRIQSLLCVYFFAMLVQTLLERELRQAMKAEKVESLPLYPEGRQCARPTARKLIDLFDPIGRHTVGGETFVTELSPVQRRVLNLLKIPSENFGR